MKKVALILILIFLSTLVVGCSQGAFKAISNSTTVSDVSASNSALSAKDSSLQPIEDSSDMLLPFYIGRWEYITFILATSNESIQDTSICYGFTFNEDQTATSWMGYPNSNIISKYEGTYCAEEVEPSGYALTLTLKQTYYDMERHKNEQDVVELVLKVVLYGPEYRAVIIFTSDDSLYGEHVVNRPYWYVLV